MALCVAATVSWGCGDDAPVKERDDGAGGAGEVAPDGGTGQVCGAEEKMPEEGDSEACAAGETALEDGRCLPAGMQENGCAAGEVMVEPGGCRPAGIPPEACGQGFEPDGESGCNVILPRDPCTKGMMAVPGDTACREVAPCGDGPWGDIPVEPDTEYVDGSYQGSTSDGSRDRPWTTINAAVREAAPGAIVAVAAGIYEESVYIQGKPVRLWGRCPALVEVVGPAPTPAVDIWQQADRTEVHGLALRGYSGIIMSGSEDVELDRVWVHDTEDVGIIVEWFGTASVKVRSSLIEDTSSAGIWVFGASASIEQTNVRDAANVGVAVQYYSESDSRSTVDIRSSLVERARSVGVLVEGSDLELLASVVRDTIPTEEPNSGRGVIIKNMGSPRARSTANIGSSLIEGNHDIGVSVSDSELLVEATVVRGTLPAPSVEEIIPGQRTLSGVGIAIRDDEHSAEPTVGTIRSSLVEDNHEEGIFVMGVAAGVEATIVRRTQPVGERESGGGISVRNGFAPARRRGDVRVSSSVIEWNHSAGVVAMGATIRLDATVVRDTLPLVGSSFGVGVAVQVAPGSTERGELAMISSIIERNPYAGVLIDGSSALVQRTIVRETQRAPDGKLGRGIAVQNDGEAAQRANATISDCIVERNHETGIFVAGSEVTIEGTVVSDTKPRSDFTAGDGIVVQYGLQYGPVPELRGDATILRSTVERNTRVGIAVIGSDAVIEGSSVRETRMEPLSKDYGDGIVVVSEFNRASARIYDCRIVANDGVGVSAFGSDVWVDSTRILCNCVDLNAVAHLEQSYHFPLNASMTCLSCTDEPRKCDNGSYEKQPPRMLDPAPTPP
ncbi:right-handed parallel beta-helix repeat-containing protein [Sorangium sp. So ce590]|uniref:right-handed parallel beta-helix repeat-containing protein n=1 Tax=Sorangium sp. So ce590 TaxID=3133317 RepID=UPI003F617C74